MLLLKAIPHPRGMKMIIITDGLVIKETSTKENDKVITILTRDRGIIRAFANNAKKLGDPKNNATGLLAYSKFEIYKGKNAYSVNSAEVKELFMPLRSDLAKMALAQYICELSGELSPREENSEEQLRLLLNTLHFIAKGDRNDRTLKAVFELRSMALAGYMPNLVCCDNCKCYEHERMHFLPDTGIFVCGDCLKLYKQKAVFVGINAAYAMRHTIYSEMNMLFALNLDPDTLNIFERTCELYALRHIDRQLKTLDFYKIIRK